MSDEPIVLGGRYELLKVIGRGGMAEVWRARDKRLSRDVAVKRLRVDLATDSTFQARFQREAHSAAGLNHPNIVSVYDTGEMVDQMTGIMVPYIVMELVEGQTLRDILRSGTKIEPQRAFEYTTGVLEALSYSHQRNIVHRDIKPANVMITPTGQVKVMDFGIARAVSDTSATMTQTAAVIGTAQYLSPEQARGEQVDARSDIYSAGCLLYELLTSRPPFVGDSPVSVAYQHVREMPVPPSQLDDSITAQMDAVTIKALAKDPADRYQTARQMNDDCWRLLNGHAITAAMPAVVPPTEVLPTTTAPTRALPPEEDPTWHDAPAVAEEEYYEEEPAKSRLSAASVVLIGLLILVLAALGFFAWKVLAPNPADNIVSVPDVTGFQEDAAREQIEKEQLVAKVAHASGPAEGKGTVLKQDPKGGTTIQVGSTVTITINDGPPMTEIPDGLVGKSKKDASRLLKEAGFTNVTVLDAPGGQEPPESREGDVVKVEPEAGSKISADQQVILYVASGQSPLPNVMGKGEAEAREILSQAGFTSVETRLQQTNDHPAGTVVNTLPSVGESWGRSRKVIIEVAEAAPEPTVPPVTQEPPPPAPTEPAPPVEPSVPAHTGG